MTNTSKRIGVAAALLAGGLAGVASAQSWDGAYIGAALGGSNGDYNHADTLGNFNSGNGQVFAGYNYSMGKMVMGGEVATVLGNITTTDAGNYIRNLTDLKFRFGTTFGSALVYASLGYSVGGSTSDGFNYDFNGVNYGIGMDYAVNDRIFVGAEIVARNIDDGLGYLDTRPMTTASVRAGFRF